jgi:hypothetical protein
MNSFVCPKYARRVLMALAVVTGTFLTVGCGSGNGFTKPNPVGFSNSNLSGTYVFSSSGEDGNGAFIAVAGALVANGSGGITGGTMDVVDAGVTPPSPVAQPITGGSYSVSSDGRGQVNLSSSVGSFSFDFVLTSSTHGLVTEFDGNATGSGTIDLQTAVPSLSQLAGSYAFSLGGIDSNSNPFATTGSFTLNSSGAVTAGVEDFNEAGVPFTNVPLTGGPATVGSGSGPGTITLTANFGPLIFDFYPIDAAHWKFIETDFTTAILAGDVFSQTGVSIPTGPMVFTMAGGVTAPIAVGGLMTSDGTGNFTAGLEDVNNNGAISGAQVPFTGTAAAGGSIGGRVIVNLSGFVPATQWVIYPSSGGLLMLETDSATLTLGAAYAQTSQTLAASQNYGLNLSAFNTSFGVEEDDIAQFNTTSTGLTGVVDINDDTVLSFDRKLTGNYTLDSPATGRGEATTTASNNSFVSFVFYVVNGSTALLLETDNNQIGAGTFELQSSSAAAPVVLSRMLTTRPGGRPHGALRRK